MPTTLSFGDETGTAILDRVIQPRRGMMTADAARTLLSFKFQKRDELRMNHLAAKARRGTLTRREKALAEQYDMVSHMLALLQAKARQTLTQHDRHASS